jgi:tRNA-Thr(GGU) m(6)t(6)A37 methyltransferase TsaA
MSQNEFTLSAIGFVHQEGEVFRLDIEPAYRAALNGLQGFSHINVLFWAHYLDQPQYRSVMEVDQPYQHSPAKLGIFATRSPMRPNPILVTVSQVIHLDAEAGKILVAYIDAEEGSPILDIKPYLPCSDRVREVQTPQWNSHWPQCYEDSAEFDWASEFVNAQ